MCVPAACRSSIVRSAAGGLGRALFVPRASAALLVGRKRRHDGHAKGGAQQAGRVLSEGQGGGMARQARLEKVEELVG